MNIKNRLFIVLALIMSVTVSSNLFSDNCDAQLNAFFEAHKNDQKDDNTFVFIQEVNDQIYLLKNEIPLLKSVVKEYEENLAQGPTNPEVDWKKEKRSIQKNIYRTNNKINCFQRELARLEQQKDSSFLKRKLQVSY